MTLKNHHHHKFHQFEEEFGQQAAEDVMTAICESHWNQPKMYQADHAGVTFTEIHEHDAINHTLSGRIEWQGIEYGFIVRNGNWDGTTVLEWGLAEDVGRYVPPQPTVYVCVPRNSVGFLNTLHGFYMFRDVFLAWKKEEWVKEIERSYNYDRHFQPGSKTETYWQAKAGQRGLKLEHPEVLERLMKEFEPLNAMTKEQLEEHYRQRDAITAATLAFMAQ